VFRKLAMQKESRVEEGHLMPDHVHMMISIPPKYAVSQVIGSIKGKSAIHLARVYGERMRNFTGQHFWARGYFVSTVGRDETVIREYIRKQEAECHRERPRAIEQNRFARMGRFARCSELISTGLSREAMEDRTHACHCPSEVISERDAYPMP
jgi:REP element-mobilizing transposase RayT